MLPRTWMHKYLYETLLSKLLGLYPEVKLIDHLVIILLFFCGTTIPFFTAAVPDFIFTNNFTEFWSIECLSNYFDIFLLGSEYCAVSCEYLLQTRLYFSYFFFLLCLWELYSKTYLMLIYVTRWFRVSLDFFSEWKQVGPSLIPLMEKQLELQGFLGSF